jgi:hypothetical protein
MMTRLILAFILLNLGCSDINKSNEKNGLSELKYYLGADLSTNKKNAQASLAFFLVVRFIRDQNLW